MIPIQRALPVMRDGIELKTLMCSLSTMSSCPMWMTTTMRPMLMEDLLSRFLVAFLHLRSPVRRKCLDTT